MAEANRKRKRHDQLDRAASEQSARTHDNVVRTRPDHPGMDASLADVLDDEVARERMSEVPEHEKPSE
jgi:hypothetical protein